MTLPSDLISHYSSKAFQTRMYALTIAIGALVAGLRWAPDVSNSFWFGSFLILIVVSLAELNRRYTRSYLCACFASAFPQEAGSTELDHERWAVFRFTNETPWTPLLSRFLLSWLTYLPGLVVGGTIMFAAGGAYAKWLGVAVPLLIAGWWLKYSAKTEDLKSYLPESLRNRMEQRYPSGPTANEEP